MLDRGTTLSLEEPNKEPKKLLKYAKYLDAMRPRFVKRTDPFRNAYANHFESVVTSPKSPLSSSKRSMEDLRRTTDWLREARGGLYQTELWKFLDKSDLLQQSRDYLKRASDTCYYLAQGEALEVSYLSLDSIGAQVVDALSDPAGRTMDEKGKRVEQARSKFQGSDLVELTFRDVASLRGDPAFGYLRKELQKLTEGKTQLGKIVEKMDDCIEPLRELKSKSRAEGRAELLKELKSGKRVANRGVVIKIVVGAGAVTLGTVLSVLAPLVFPLPAAITLGGAVLGLAGLLPDARAAAVVSANYKLAGRYAKLLDER